ncbi:nucleotidyltransferase domain-containing protein [Candidatus Woesearchaeota archaeon]|nr:nucleotidyltransferase domain-containing protein [Candidatus Woesearchaeota archaeon]
MAFLKKRVKEFKAVKKEGLSDEYNVAYDFAIKVYRRFNDVIKSIVLFGSAAKNEMKKGSDIDLIIIIDDCTIVWDQTLIAWYRQELTKIVAAQKYRERLHINTVQMTIFWEQVRNGSPLIINVIRYGQPLIDYGGFFEPLKVLLARGKIRPSVEATYQSLRTAPMHIARAKLNVLGAIENLYWSMVDSSHAALMALKQVPPSPEHISEMLIEVFVKQRKLDKKYVEYYNQVYNLYHNINRGNINSISGKEVDEHIDKAIEFERVLRNLTIDAVKQEKIVKIEIKK